MALLIGLSTLITVMVGGLDVANQVPGASVGKIAEFVMYIQMLTFPVSAIGWTASMTQRAVASQRRINEFLLREPSIKDNAGAQPLVLKGQIKFSSASFIYKDTGIQAIKNLNLTILAGERIAVIGRTGSGKSTLAQMLLRMYDLDKGELLFDGVPAKEITLNSLRNGISYVPQDIFLFSDTIENNIRFGLQKATKEEVIAAAKMAGIDSEIMQFPEGYQTMVGERGVTLSGGQKQRISIARALIKEARIVVFDDCLSAVDAKTEREIADRMQPFLEGKTSIIITHRIFSLFQFDRILVMEEGELAESGTHEELMAKKALYYDMYVRQQLQDADRP
jgi:ATP-binding cassette subfamily B protein